MLCDAHESYQSGAPLGISRQSPPQQPWCTARHPASGRTRPCRWSIGAARRTAPWLSWGWLGSAYDCRDGTWSGTCTARSGSRCRPCAAAELSGRRSPGGRGFGVSWVVSLHGGVDGFCQIIPLVPLWAESFEQMRCSCVRLHDRLRLAEEVAQLLALGRQHLVVAEADKRLTPLGAIIECDNWQRVSGGRRIPRHHLRLIGCHGWPPCMAASMARSTARLSCSSRISPL